MCRNDYIPTLIWILWRSRLFFNNPDVPGAAREIPHKLFVTLSSSAGFACGREPIAPFRWETNSDKPEFGIGTKRNKPGVEDGCKLLKRWWPGTESNRRRQPFQGCLPTLLSGSGSVEVHVQKRLTSDGDWDQVRMIWASFARSMFPYCSPWQQAHVQSRDSALRTPAG